MLFYACFVVVSKIHIFACHVTILMIFNTCLGSASKEEIVFPPNRNFGMLFQDDKREMLKFKDKLLFLEIFV